MNKEELKMNKEELKDLVNPLISHYLNDEIEFFVEQGDYNEEYFNDNILGTWFKLIEELPEGKEFVESTKLKIKNDIENPN
tara:strand:- start:205 stop:447 length:243 start_codon:yes stop_codon:yes gene_type:complete